MIERADGRPLSSHDDPIPRVELVEGDNLAVMQRLALDPAVCGRIALAYLDPPFGTGRSFGAYDDRWSGGRAELVEILRPRLTLVHQLLAVDGSILVHLDHRIAHVVAVLLDDLFGPGDRDPRRSTPGPGFRSELIWTYGLGGSSSRVYPRKHDTILWYSKGAEWTFDAPRIPARSARMRGQSKKQLDVMMGPPRLDGDAAEASSLGDVWDVAAINNMARERTGYPTQKPLALLERLVAAHTREGDLVLDPCCGSGTTLVAAQTLGRRAIGIDESPEAIRVSRARLLAGQSTRT
jgi:site-specific DNA-methyltransferase (adenine-specific)